MVIETSLTVDFIKKSYQEFLDFRNQVLISKDDIDWFYEIASRYSECDNAYDLGVILEETVDKALQYKKLDFQCSICEETIPFSKHHIEWVHDKLSKSWYHKRCSNIHSEF
ncbi:MAG: hypothetical protein J4F36_03760 [Nitrosopumilaceae archaeon]|nr:hypothetical protein [Nitrosopumilaceae archaeon]